MRYHVADIEDQIIATLQADSGLSGVNVATHAGQINAQTFLSPDGINEFIANLPFIYVQYQGRIWITSDAPRQTFVHEIRFRLYAGAQGLRDKQEAQRGVYSFLESIYDDLHGRVPKCTPQLLPVLPVLGGTAITVSGFNIQRPMMEVEGLDERLIVNLPGIVVYSTDYSVRLLP